MEKINEEDESAREMPKTQSRRMVKEFCVVPHAMWKITADGIRCSKCRMLLTLFNIRNNYYCPDNKASILTDELMVVRKLYNYCPVCGARMDEDTDREMKRAR